MASNRRTTNLSALFTLGLFISSFLRFFLKGSLRQPFPAFLKSEREAEWLGSAVTGMAVGGSSLGEDMHIKLIANPPVRCREGGLLSRMRPALQPGRQLGLGSTSPVSARQAATHAKCSCGGLRDFFFLSAVLQPHRLTTPSTD